MITLTQIDDNDLISKILINKAHIVSIIEGEQTYIYLSGGVGYMVIETIEEINLLLTMV
tara:strand:+ start:2697 stop:2873 length:177 start_codon:yes stop_codon:yes gene_type:complete